MPNTTEEICTDFKKEFEASVEATNAWAKHVLDDEEALGVLTADDGSAPAFLREVGGKYYWVITPNTEEDAEDEDFERYAWERTANNGLGRFVGKLVDEYAEEEEYAFEMCAEPEYEA
jgi:hypothetical protein